MTGTSNSSCGDKYPNFESLRRTEAARAFHIECHARGSTVAVIAPHGGKIERWTSPIAAAIAGTDYNLYQFEGLKAQNNRDLHITSSRFDEPQCLALVVNCDQVVAVHGCAGGEPVVYLGGLDYGLRDAVRERLEAYGFASGVHENPDLQGTHPNNICNRGGRGCGVQLELSYGFRSALMTQQGRLKEFADAVREAIESNC